MTNIDIILQFVSLAAWVVFILYALAVFVRSFLREGALTALLRMVSPRVLLPLLLTVGISLLSAAILFVEPTRVAVIVSLLSAGGVRPEPLRAGLHLIVPGLESGVIYSIAWETYTMSASPNEGEVKGNDSIRARTSDGQEVRIDTSIIFRVNAAQVVTLHIDWQDRYTEKYVRPVIQGLVRTRASQFTAREVSGSARRNLELSLEQALREEFAAKGLLVDQFLLRDITFTDEYAAAVEQKQVAAEGMERTEYEAQQIRNLAEGERDRLITEAQGQAEAILIQSEAQAEALRRIGVALAENPDLLTYSYIEKLSPNIRAMLVPSDTPLILPLPNLEDGEDGALSALPSAPLTAPLTGTVPMTSTLDPSALDPSALDPGALNPGGAVQLPEVTPTPAPANGNG